MSRSLFVVVALALALAPFACSDVLGLGKAREMWPAEASAATLAGEGAAESDVAEAGQFQDLDSSNAAQDGQSTQGRRDGGIADAAVDTGADEPTDTGADQTSDTLSLEAVDTSFPSVGFVTGTTSPVNPTLQSGSPGYANELVAASTLVCSGVLIGPSTVLTSADCLAGDPKATRFALNPTGDALSHPDRTVVYAIDRIHLSGTGQAVAHLAVAGGQPQPASLASPLLTMVGTDGMASPFGWHANASASQTLGSVNATAVSWRVEGPGTVVRRAQPASVTTVDASTLRLTLANQSVAYASDIGAPGLAFVAGQWMVVGTVYQEDTSTRSYQPTFTSGGMTAIELMLWLDDDVMIPGVRAPPSAGAYTWTGVNMYQEDPFLNPAPATFYVVGTETDAYSSGTTAQHSFGICTTWYDEQQIPGVFFTAGGCSFAWNQIENWVGIYKVLSVQGSATWQSADAGSIPAGAFAAGYVGTAPLLACRSSFVFTSSSGTANGVNPGVIRDGGCVTTWGSQEYDYSTFETLFIGQ